MIDITVIVPCYNSENTIKRCIDSLLAQTTTVKICIVDDGSTDGTFEIANEYSKNNEHIYVVSHDNIGSSQSRKSGLDTVTTKYVGFVDSDDWVEPDMYKSLRELAEQNNAQVAVCSISYDTPQGTTAEHPSTTENDCISGPEALTHLHKRDGIYTSMCNKLFLAESLSGIVFPTGNFIGEDYSVLLSYLSCKIKVAVTNKPYYHYVQHLGSMSKNEYNDSHKIAFYYYKDLYESQTTTDTAMIEHMADYLCVEYAAILVAMARNAVYDKAVMKYIQKFIRTHLYTLLKEKIDVYYKAAALTIAIHSRLFVFLYRLYFNG